MSPVRKTVRKTIKKKAAKKSAAPGKAADFEAVFSALRGLLEPYQSTLAFKAAKPGFCYLESRTPTYRNRPMFFAGVRTGKNYVSYYLMSVYACPEQLKAMSPGLKKRMQGKACFNFTAVDQELLGELARLTEAGYQKFKSMEYL
jgi:hypothetical protein